MDEAKLMIKKAFDVGCFAAKFQLFNREVAPNLPEHLYLTKEQARELFEYMKIFPEPLKSFPVFFTPMFEEAVDWCEDIGVNYYKIRYKDSPNIKLINKIKKTGKPCFISSYIPYRMDNFISLCCIPEYPANVLRYLYHLIKCRKFEGISDHTIDLEMFRKLQGYYDYWEKHVKLDNDCLESDWSVTFEQLAEVLAL